MILGVLASLAGPGLDGDPALSDVEFSCMERPTSYPGRPEGSAYDARIELQEDLVA